MDLEDQESSEDGEDVSPFLTPKKTAGLFFHQSGGVLQIPGSDVILQVPPGAVPEGKAYVVYGTIHTNIKVYHPFMASADEYIISPVVEYRTEHNETFDRPVEISIPHFLQPRMTDNIHVLCGNGKECRELLKSDTDITFSVGPHFINILTRCSGKFIVTKTGRVQEIGDLLVTVSAKQMKTQTKSISCLRVMIHSGLSLLNDFADQRKMYYDRTMKEIVTYRTSLHESEEPLQIPDVNVSMSIRDNCDAVIDFSDTPKKRERRINGKDVLKPSYPSQNRSETLAEFVVEHPLNSQVDCLLKVVFTYKEDIPPVVSDFSILYPKSQVQLATGPQSHEQREEDSGALTNEPREELINANRPWLLRSLDQPSTSAAAATFHPPGLPSPSSAADAAPQASGQQPTSGRQRAAASQGVLHSGIPRPARQPKPKSSKQGSATGKK